MPPFGHSPCPHHHRRPITTTTTTTSHPVPFSSRSRGGGRRRCFAAMATAPGDATPAAAAASTPYSEPLAADARVVVRDSSLGVSAQVLGERLAHRRYLATFDRLVRFTRPGPAPGGQGEVAAVAATTTADAPDQQQQQHHHDVSYDVIGHPRCEFRFAVVFPYHPPEGGRSGGDGTTTTATAKDEGEVTLVREYAHGPHRFVYTLPSGQFERHKHGGGEGEGCGGGGAAGGSAAAEQPTGLLATAMAELEEEAQLEGGKWHRLLPEGHPGIPEVKWCANAFEPFLCVGPTPHPSPAARDGEEEAAGIEAVRVPLREFRRLAASGEMLLPSVATGWMAIERLKELGYVSS